MTDHFLNYFRMSSFQVPSNVVRLLFLSINPLLYTCSKMKEAEM